MHLIEAAQGHKLNRNSMSIFPEAHCEFDWIAFPAYRPRLTMQPLWKEMTPVNTSNWPINTKLQSQKNTTVNSKVVANGVFLIEGSTS